MKLGDTTQHLNQGAVMDWLKGITIPKERKPLPSLPAVNQKIDHEAFKILFRDTLDKRAGKKLDNQRLEELLATARSYYRQFPSEAETLAFLVVPLFQLFGWKQNQMSLEWQRVDMALFEGEKNKEENLKVVIEAKRHGYSCLTAFKQADNYAKRYKNCEQLVLTDGIRFAVYNRRGETFNLEGYLNLLNPVEHYAIYNCAGAQVVINALMNARN